VVKIYMPIMCIAEFGRDVQRFQNYFESLASPGTEITWEPAEKGTETIDSAYDEAMCAPFMVQKIQRAKEKGYDAVIIYCMADPGLVAAREATDVPVVGLGQASMTVASSLGRRFSIVDPSPHPGLYRDLVALYSLEDHVASIRNLKITVPELVSNVAQHKTAILEAGKKAIEEDGADALILGCGFMSGISKELQAELGVPVLDPDATVIRFTEMLVHLGVSHSKKAYPFPTPKPMRM
jgi:allantoin racemase